MVPAHDIISVRYMRGEENALKLWGDPDWNARSLHIRLTLLTQGKEGKGSKGIVHRMDLFTFEQNSKVMFHVSGMWIDCYTRMRAEIPVVKEQSEVELASDFFSEVESMLSNDKFAYGEHTHAMTFLASELINDITLKKLFFKAPQVLHFAFACMSGFEADMNREKGSKSNCLLLLRRLVSCLKLVVAALFNSSAVTERYQFYFMGNTLMEHIEMYSRDFHSFIAAFEASTGFTPIKLTINDAKKLNTLRNIRRSIGKHSFSKHGMMTRDSMKAILNMDDGRTR